MMTIQDQQEVMGAIADMTIEIYAMESAVLRAQKMSEQKGETAATLPIVWLSGWLLWIASRDDLGIPRFGEGRAPTLFRSLLVHDPRPDLLLRQVFRDMDGNFFETELQRGLIASVPAYDYALGIDDDGLAKAELTQRRRHGVDRLVIVAWVAGIGPNL